MADALTLRLQESEARCEAMRDHIGMKWVCGGCDRTVQQRIEEEQDDADFKADDCYDCGDSVRLWRALPAPSLVTDEAVEEYAKWLHGASGRRSEDMRGNLVTAEWNAGRPPSLSHDQREEWRRAARAVLERGTRPFVSIEAHDLKVKAAAFREAESYLKIRGAKCEQSIAGELEKENYRAVWESRALAAVLRNIGFEMECLANATEARARKIEGTTPNDKGERT